MQVFIWFTRGGRAVDITHYCLLTTSLGQRLDNRAEQLVQSENTMHHTTFIMLNNGKWNPHHTQANYIL